MRIGNAARRFFAILDCGSHRPKPRGPGHDDEEHAMHRLVFALVLMLSAPAVTAMAARAAERWEILPPTPTPIAADRSGDAAVNGISIHYFVYGKGTPVILLHGGLANSDYWGHQITALAPNHMVIVMASRGHGRSTRDARGFG